MDCIYNPIPLRRTVKYSDWLLTPVYMNAGVTEVTMQEAMSEFFFCGVCHWVNYCGYSWSMSDADIHRKFMNFAYTLCSTLDASKTATLQPPYPNHRDLPDDRETFDLYADMLSFTGFLNNWHFRDEIVGTRLDFLIREFCYTWIDVEKGKPGRWTQAVIDMNEEDNSDDDRGFMLPDGNWSRRKHDLY